jgi:hypothetical protein
MRQIPEEDNTKKKACLKQLSECIRKKVRVNGLDLREVHLVGAELSKLEADQLDLSSANLQGAKFLEVRLGNCNFTQVILNDTIWSNATVRMCLFDGMQGLKACFDWARIEDSSMKGEYNHNVEQNPPHHESNVPKTAVARDSFPLAFVERHKQLKGEQADCRIVW